MGGLAAKGTFPEEIGALFTCTKIHLFEFRPSCHDVSISVLQI